LATRHETIVFAIPFRRVFKALVFRCGSAKIHLRGCLMPKGVRILRFHRKIIGDLVVVNPDAAGIDAGSGQHWVSVPEDRSDESVRSFGTFTADLEALAEWLVACGVKTVAIEATGVYWIPLFDVLEQHGLNPRLVDSRSIGGRRKKTDVVDCQWIRQLHTYGLLDGAFRPSAEILPMRAYLRQRDMLVRYAADHIRHIQKALDLMNVKLHLVVSDTVGVTGLRMIQAILAGRRNPTELATLREPNCTSSEETFVKALSGTYAAEHLFALEQAIDLFSTYQKKIEQCDARIAAVLKSFDKKADPETLPKKKRKPRRKNQPHFDGRSLLYQMTGVDLTAVAGLESSTILTILSETGIDMSPWHSGKHFAAWLALSPNNRAAQAFRLAAQTLERTQSALGAFFRRIQSRIGRAGAIKATAHKLALIFYAMLKNKTEYRDPGISYYEERYRQRLLNSLQKKAATLGFNLTPATEVH
jgi:transposase